MQNLLAETGDTFATAHQVHLETALDVGLAISSSELATDTLSWLSNKAVLGYTYLDASQRLRIVGPQVAGPDGLTIVIVDDRNPLGKLYPEIREYPMYHDTSNFMSLPVEAFSWTGMLSTLLLHEGIHARDFKSPRFATEANALFEGLTVDDPVAKASEIKAFTAEGQFLCDLFGDDFGKWLTQRVNDFSNSMLEQLGDESSGEAINLGFCTIDEVREVMNGQISFMNPVHEEFCGSMLTESIPTAGGLAMCELLNRSQTLPRMNLVSLQLSSLGDTYR